jgi:DNA-binding protein H-NS
MTDAVDLERLRLDELKALAKDIEKAIGKRQADTIKKARAAAEAAVREFGYSLDEIIGPKASGQGVETRNVKYRNPRNSNQTWSGRGRQPQWFKDAVASGQAPEELAA